MSCDEPDPVLMDWQQARQHLIAATEPVVETERVALEHATGRYLAVTPQAQCDMPPWDNSAMDGFALCAEPEQNIVANRVFDVVGEALAGHPLSITLQAGQCALITTGAPIPKGTTAVVPVEKTQRAGQSVQITSEITCGANIRRQGEDARKSEFLLRQGKRLSALDVGAVAALGVDRLSVYRRLRIGLLSTGDELCKPGQGLRAGQIYDANGPLLKAALESMGYLVELLPPLPDQLDTVRRVLSKASDQYDALISSGGVSVGEADHLKTVLAELGAVDFWKVAIKPGKPFAAGRIGDCRFYGLPGNPVSAAITLIALASAGLECQAGGEPSSSLPYYQARVSKAFKKRVGRTDFQRARRYEAHGQIWVEPLVSQGSHQIQMLASADCLVVLPRESEGLAEGEWATVLPLSMC
ncbi:molybdopterin biosynthesis protein [gamma proteobacterium HTCC5015]|nr:molybdopterin biosynthesis protein [gamma proteobacterium HTCC5015]